MLQQSANPRMVHALGCRGLPQCRSHLRIVQKCLQQRLQVRIAEARHPPLQLRPHFVDVPLGLRNKIAKVVLIRSCPANLLHLDLQLLVESANLAEHLHHIARIELARAVGIPHPGFDLPGAIAKRQRKVAPAISARAHLFPAHREKTGNLTAGQIGNHWFFHLIQNCGVVPCWGGVVLWVPGGVVCAGGVPV